MFLLVRIDSTYAACQTAYPCPPPAVTAAATAAGPWLELEQQQQQKQGCSSATQHHRLETGGNTVHGLHSAICWMLACPAASTDEAVATACILSGPRVWGYGAPVRALPSMGRCVFCLMWHMSLPCVARLFSGVWAFPGSALLSLQPLPALAACGCEVPYRSSCFAGV